MKAFLDDYWERLKAEHPALADWDMVRDQSQTHHTLNTGLGFGTLGCLISLLVSTTWAQGWACGVIGGLAGYAMRERLPFRWFVHTFPGSAFSLAVDHWDGTMDVLVPSVRLLPLALAALLWPQMPVWLVPLAQLLMVAEAVGYSFARPFGSLFYGGHGQREDVCKELA